MRKTVSFTPPSYPIAFLSNPGGGRAPFPTGAKAGDILATSTCISFPTLNPYDGPTHFTLGDFREVMPQRVPQQAPAFDGYLETPEKRIVLSTAEYESFLEMPVRTKKTRVRIWTNHPTEPDEVIIGVE
jgi:hypothetical protein